MLRDWLIDGSIKMFSTKKIRRVINAYIRIVSKQLFKGFSRI